MAKKKLTFKQELFCHEYVNNGGNASEAYRRAYNPDKKTKQETIWNNGYKLLQDNEVVARIAQLKSRVFDTSKLTREWLTQQLMDIVTVTNSNNRPAAKRQTLMDIAKLNGLVKKDDELGDNVNFTIMTTVKVDGKDLELKVGAPPDKVAKPTKR